VKPDKTKSKASLKDISFLSDNSLFPIVGIGASAGGLEAIEQFLANVLENSGMAYIVVQHLDPTHKGMLPELLQRISKMKVSQVKDRMDSKTKLRLCNSTK
jgi:two-component system CheB/CheR fusion protein